MMTKNMNLVQEAFKNDDTVLMLSHSVTPTKDSVPQLKKYAINTNIGKNWHLVTGYKKEIYDLGRTAYFVENDLGEPKDYEIRFYDSHQDAINLGKEYADNISGENGCMSKDCALWKDGIKDRIRMSDLGTLHPKYMDYIIYDNFILFCPGYDEREAKLNCNFVIENIKN